MQKKTAPPASAPQTYSDREAIKLANEHYNILILAALNDGQKHQKINIVLSSVSDQITESVNELARIVPSLRVQREFNESTHIVVVESEGYEAKKDLTGKGGRRGTGRPNAVSSVTQADHTPAMLSKGDDSDGSGDGGDGSDEELDLSKSRLRTMKVMRSMLHGLPIVTEKWVRACIQADQLIRFSFKKGASCVRTIPVRREQLLLAVDDEEDHASALPTARYAVAHAAAKINAAGKQKGGGVGGVGVLPFANLGVYLCGDTWTSTPTGSKRKGEKGVMKGEEEATLIAEGGGAVLGSAAAVTKLIKAHTKNPEGQQGVSRILILCDDAKSDATSGLNFGTLHTAINNCLAETTTFVRVVSFSWLYDSISAFAPLGLELYAPNEKSLIANQFFEFGKMLDDQVQG